MAAPTDPLDLFLNAARENPDRPAVSSGAETVSYAEMAVRTMRLARTIRSAGTPHPRVAISLPKGAWAYAAMFASLMAGGYYTPLNLEHPLEKQNRTVSQFKPDVLVTMTRTEAAGLAIPDGCIVAAIDDLLEAPGALDPEAPHDLAYVMFTSGSTGQPKGVMIPRDALAHYVRWAHDAMSVTPEDRWSQHPNIAFDLSVLDIFGALCAGACLFPIVTKKDKLLPADFILRHGLTIWNSVPSVIDLMVKARQVTPERLGSLRLATFCGEPLLRQHLDALFAARSDLLVHNTYGPTEATVSMTLVALTTGNYHEKCANSVTLGEPVAGMQILLEDGDTPDEGEAVIAGPQVARGYWENPELTSTAFGERNVDGESLPAYRTGDWVRRKGKDLYFVARIDRQIKRHGFRLELGEIDSACRDAGATAACTVYIDEKLVTFLEGVDDAQQPELLRRLAAVLPGYAMPTEVRSLPILPRTANDKIDAMALEATLRHGL